MTANTPYDFPEVLVESSNLAQAFVSDQLSPKMIREDEKAQEAMTKGELSKSFMSSPNGLPFYMAHTAPTEESSAIAFERHFNPVLKYDSDYHKNLNAMLSCVEKNASSAIHVDQ